MQRTRRIAAAATASAVVVAGTITAFAVTASSAKADGAVGSCKITATTAAPQACKVTDTNNSTAISIATPQNMTLHLTVGSNADVTTVAWTSACFNGGGGAFNPQSGSKEYNGTGDPSGTSFFLSLDPQDMASTPAFCNVTATLTAKTAVTASDTETLSLSFVSQPQSASPSPTSASPTPTHTPSGPGLTGIIKGFDGKCVDDAGNSSSQRATVQIWSCNGGKAQKWTYTGGEVKHNGLCLNAKGAGKSGSKAILWACNGAPNEIWIFNTINHEVILKANGFSVCLDDPAYSTRNGTQLMVYTCHNTPNQHWSLP